MWYPYHPSPLNSNCQICPDQIDGRLVWAMTPGWLITNRGGTRLRLAREWNLEVSSSGLAQSSRGCHMWALNTALPTPHRAAVLLGLGGPHSYHHCPPCSNVWFLLLLMLILKNVLTRVWCRYGSWSLVIELNFCPDFEHKVRSRFGSWSLVSILLLIFGWGYEDYSRLRFWSYVCSRFSVVKHLFKTTLHFKMSSWAKKGEHRICLAA